MRCLADKTISMYLDNGFPVQKAKKIEQHLDRCDVCRERAVKMKEETGWLYRELSILDPAEITQPEFVMPQKTVVPLLKRFADYYTPGRPQWPVPVVFAVLLILVMILLPIWFDIKETGRHFPAHSIIRSVKMGDHPVETYVYNEPGTRTTIVWIESGSWGKQIIQGNKGD